MLKSLLWGVLFNTFRKNKNQYGHLVNLFLVLFYDAKKRENLFMSWQKREAICKSYRVLFIPVEVDMIWWIERFGNWCKYVHELSVEDVLKPEVHHRPDIQEEGKVT